MKTLQSYFNHPTLRKLRSKASIMAQANEHLQGLLPDTLSSHCVLANFSHDHVLIGTASACYISQLQAMKQWLLNNLKAHPPLRQAASLTFIVMPNLYPTPKAESKKCSLSDNTKKLIINSSKNIKNQSLKRSLERLAAQAPTSSGD